jgi:hypothetical protein
VRAAVVQAPRQRRRALTDDAGPPDGARRPRRRGREQARVEPQPGDHADAPARRVEQLEDGGAAVGHGHDPAVRQPSGHLEERLPGPVGQPLVAPAPLSRAHRSDGASTVRKGSARARPAQGTGTTSMRESQRSPLASTKWPCEERTGSR